MTPHQRFNARLVLFCALALSLGACGLPTSAQRAAPHSTATPQATQQARKQPATYLRPGTWSVASVRAILTSEFPQNHIPPFDKTSTSAAKAQALYRALLALPVMPAGSYSCPIDWGNTYHLRFFDASSQRVATALVHPDGCGAAILPDGSQRWTATDQGFWVTFAAAMNVSIATVRNPTPHPSGSSAPTSLPD